jgi:hypothetical protein
LNERNGLDDLGDEVGVYLGRSSVLGLGLAWTQLGETIVLERVGVRMVVIFVAGVLVT